MLRCDVCGMEASLASGMYSDGDCTCADCLSSHFYSFQLNSSNEVLHLKHKKGQKQVKDKLSPQKQLEKAGRLAGNIRNMIKSGGNLTINSRNEKAFFEAVKQVGMRIDAFTIERDGCYLKICLKCNNVRESKLAMLPKLLERPKLPDKNQN
jgi:hypothetical protein